MFVSEFLLWHCASHSKEINEEIKGHPAFLKALKMSRRKLSQSHRHVLKFSEHVPTLFITYEMLILDTEKTLTDLFRFLFDLPSLKGTLLEKRIKDVCAEGHESKAIYGLKTTAQKQNLSRNQHCYSDDDITQIKTDLRDFLHFFGYASHPTEPNQTAFFKFDDQSETDLANWNMFRKLNDQTLAKLGTLNETPAFTFNPADCEQAPPDEFQDLKEFTALASLSSIKD